MEIKEGKEPMGVKEFTDDFKLIAACTFRLAKYTKQKFCEDGDRNNRNNNQTVTNTYTGDSWSGSVKVCTQYVLQLQSNFIEVIKNSHSLFPKLFVENTMKYCGGGTHLVLQPNYKGFDLVQIQ
jgi:hypothetical protein